MLFLSKYINNNLSLYIIIEAVRIPYLQAIFINDNDIECDCNLAPLESDLTNRDSRIFKILQVEELECSFPRSLQGKKLMDLDVTHLTCATDMLSLGDHPAKHGGIGVVGFLFGIVAAVAGVAGYRRFKRYRITQNYPRRYQGTHILYSNSPVGF